MSSHADWASLPLEIRQMIIRQTLHNCLRHRSCGFLLRTLRSLLLINHAFSRDDLLPALRQVKQQLEQEDAAKESALRARHAISVKGHDEMAADDNYLRDRSLYYRRTNRHYHLISKAIGHTEQQIVRYPSFRCIFVADEVSRRGLRKVVCVGRTEKWRMSQRKSMRSNAVVSRVYIWVV